MKVYVASSNKNREATSAAIALLTRAGHEVPYDWTPNSVVGVSDRAKRDEMLARFAVEDIEGVRAADAVLVLSHPLMNATLVEFGVGVALNKRLIVVGAEEPGIRYCIFFRLPSVVHVDTIETAITLLQEKWFSPGITPAFANDRESFDM